MYSLPSASYAFARSSHLYRVPDRKLPLQRHIPAGRTLHLVDIENLVGGAMASPELLRCTVQHYHETTPVKVGDLVVLAAGPTLAFEAGMAWPSAKLVIGRGLDGADKALLERASDIEWISTHFDRVILGSGDGIFASTLAAIQDRGVATGVVARPFTCSFKLRRHASFLVSLPTVTPSLQIA